MKKDKSLNDEQNLAVYSRGSSILIELILYYQNFLQKQLL